MLPLSKICDSADWFEPEFNRIIREELEEVPKFHRKQWEFAMIYYILEKQGLISEDKIGLSVGGGYERVLYSIARRINHLTVTDLYELETTWDTARTDSPEALIKQRMPFNMDINKLSVINMDMRDLKFEDNSFDFCYSSCSVEHIGSFEDFLKHLDEVWRVLKEEGIYVFTTELHLGDETIRDPNNYIFSPSYLAKFINESRLSVGSQPNIFLSEHNSNYPFPSNIKNICSDDDKNIISKIMADFNHTILLHGKYPFTSISLVLRKKKIKAQTGLIYHGFDKTKKFLYEGSVRYKNWIEDKEVSINPFSSLPNSVSRFFQNHAEFFESGFTFNETDNTVFHSDYFWLSNGNRNFNIQLQVNTFNNRLENKIELRVHHYATLNSAEVSCCAKMVIDITDLNSINVDLNVEVKDDYCYAILGKKISGDFTLNSIKLKSCLMKNLTAKSNENHNHNYNQEISVKDL
ncbi:MAG: class I SAM-dependent methyltransferase [Ignavibacteriales bacterium]|nr:class I SAM-dependent methyltransferase [Ignavibacteriales bacterium]